MSKDEKIVKNPDLELMFTKETGVDWCFVTDAEYIRWLEEKLVKNNDHKHIVSNF